MFFYIPNFYGQYRNFIFKQIFSFKKTYKVIMNRLVYSINRTVLRIKKFQSKYKQKIIRLNKKKWVCMLQGDLIVLVYKNWHTFKDYRTLYLKSAVQKLIVFYPRIRVMRKKSVLASELLWMTNLTFWQESGRSTWTALLFYILQFKQY